MERSNEWNSYNRIEKVSLLAEIAVIAVAVAAMLFRIRYGIEFSDETWYVAEPYAVAEKGLIPFRNNVTQSPAFTLPLALAFKLFCSVTGGTEGIVLFSRTLFVVVSFLVAVLTVVIVKRHTSLKVPIIAIAPLFLASSSLSLFDISYNTIGLIYLPLIAALVYADFEDNSNKSLIWGFLAGIVAVRAVVGTIQIVFGLIILFLSLCFQKKTKRVVGIIFGGLIASFFLLGPVLIQYGIGSLVNWFVMYFNQAYFAIESAGMAEKIIQSKEVLQILFICAFAGIAVVAALRAAVKDNVKYSLLLGLITCILVLCGSAWDYKNADTMGFWLSAFSWFLPYMFGFFSSQKKITNQTMVISFAYLVIYFSSSYANNYGFQNGRAYWLVVPTILTVILVYNEIAFFKERDDFWSKLCKNILGYGVLLTLAVLSCVKIWSNQYVFRDDEISKLSTKVEGGIWDGLYTGEERAVCVKEIEEFLNAVTEPDDTVMCLDQVPFGYLMTNGEMCSPTALDPMQYNYGADTAVSVVYSCFHTNNTVPTKIIYILTEEGMGISIDNPDWTFNQFVDAYYDKVNTYENELFKICVYALNDQEAALQTAKEKSILIRN